MTNAATGHALHGRGKGWRKAVRFALTENPAGAPNQEPPPRIFQLIGEERAEYRAEETSPSPKTEDRQTMSAAAPDPSFIEVQFPVSKLSKESYKERKANYSQTLTGLGKWWGRKPLVLVRAVILGLLLPGTGDPKKLMTMDEEGLWRRKTKRIALRVIYA